LNKYKIGFIGLGKLGLACAEVIGAKYDVTGYDIYPRTSDVIKISDSIRGAVTGKDIVFIAVQTPHDPRYDGSQPTSHLEKRDFNYDIVKEVIVQVAPWVTPETLVVLISTVLPGTTRREFINLLPNARFVYNPYLIAMGSVKWDMVNPEMVIIGTEDGSENGDAQMLIDFYKTLMLNSPRYVVGTWDEAECIKIFYNTFISAKIGLVNMIQDVAVKQGNINVDVVTDALANSTMRIMSPKYMTAGMGDAGACVLPNFTVTVNDNDMTMEELYNIFTADKKYVVNSTSYDCESSDKKIISVVTRNMFSGEMIKFETDHGMLVITPNHLIPVYRNGSHMLIRADEVLNTDELFVFNNENPSLSI
jgi:UDP-N-acetyl-D-mannosaminuronate dehydrogenase